MTQTQTSDSSPTAQNNHGGYHRDLNRIIISTIVSIALLGGAIWGVSTVLGKFVNWLGAADLIYSAQDGAGDASGTAGSGLVLDYTGFEAGYIISDEDFYDTEAMSQEEIAEFIEEWNGGCEPGADGTVCLADYTETTDGHPADQYCSAYEGGEGETAAAIIYKAALACGINPQVLITLTQKEQSLITVSGTDLTADRYNIATGYGCPDATDCDSTFFGFANQIYYAARQFQIYLQEPEEFEIVAGQENYIAYGPGCDGSWVYVENQATASLYNYTPYQPDLMAYTGTEETCSTSGNLNFYAIFNAWFGD